MRGIPEHHTPHTLKLLTRLDNLPQLLATHISPIRSCRFTRRRPDQHLDMLILRPGLGPLVPALKVEPPAAAAAMKRIQAAMRVIVELHENRIKMHLVQQFTDILIRERTLRRRGEVEVLA